MKRTILALILINIVLLATPHERMAKAEDVLYAKISSIELGLKDSAVLGPYTFTFTDVTPDFTTAKITISTSTGSTDVYLEEGDTVYYPSETDPTFALRAVVWNLNDNPVVYLDIMSPLKLIDTLTLEEGESYTLPPSFPDIKIKLVSATTTEANFDIYLPYLTEPVMISIDTGSGKGIPYKLNEDYSYQDYLYIKVTSTTTDSATFEVYLPKVATVDFKVINYEETESTPEENTTAIVYNGLLYTDENLNINVGSTKYTIRLISVVSTKASLEVLANNTKLGTYFFDIGEMKEIKDTPLAILVQKTEPQYNRGVITVYAPINSEVSPILRTADIRVNIDTMPKDIMIDDNLIVVISVENKGKGDAYDVSITAPIPSDFKLVSSAKSWVFKTFPAFTDMPALIYVLKPTKVGEFEIGKAVVTYYDDKSLETGEKKTVTSQSLTGIRVYGIPNVQVSAVGYNGSWSNYITANVGDSVSIKFTIKADGENPEYEFITNAFLLLDFDGNLEGNSSIEVGTVKAGETKEIQANFEVLTQNLTNVKAYLIYKDPLGNEHKINLGNLVTINSVPPKVIVKEVKVWPSEDEVPDYVKKLAENSKSPETFAERVVTAVSPYIGEDTIVKLINQTLARSNTTKTAEEIYSLVSSYYRPPNPWKPVALIFLLSALIAGSLAYRYWDETEKLRKKLEKKKQRRPGGLPKKDEEQETELS